MDIREASSESQTGCQSSVETITLDKEIIRAFEALPDRSRFDPRGCGVWTFEKDTLLLRFWPIKNQKSVAKLLGVGVKAARRRYKEIVGDK